MAITLNIYIPDESFDLRSGLDTVFYFVIKAIAFYFIVVSTSNLFNVGALIYSIIKFGANADGLASAIQQLASNENTGIIKNITKSVDYLKIMNTLNDISEILKVI